MKLIFIVFCLCVTLSLENVFAQMHVSYIYLIEIVNNYKLNKNGIIQFYKFSTEKYLN